MGSLVISIVLTLVPLLGIYGLIANDLLTTVDGLFMSLILLTISGAFGCNTFSELRRQGHIGAKKTAEAEKAVAARAGTGGKTT